MDLKDLQCFIAVAEQLNFSRAAKSLYISQPSLSVRINSLEDELGAKLFVRKHQRVFLTDEGAAILPAAREILEKVSSLHFLVDRAQHISEPHQELVFGIDITEDRNLPTIESVFSSFRMHHPAISLQIVETSHQEYEQKLCSGALDFCLMVLQDDMVINSSLLSIPILSESTVMVAADAEGLSIRELLQTREVQLLFEGDRGSRWNEQYLDFLKKYMLPSKPVYVENINVLLMNLNSSKTVSFLPRTYAEELDSDRIRIIPIDLPKGNITLALLWNKLNVKPAIQLMINEFQSIQSEKE